MKIRFCACGWRINIWNFILDSSASAIWYFFFVSAIVLVFCLLFGFCNLVSAFAIWYFCSVSAIVLVFHLLFGFCNLVSASAIWYSSSLRFLQFGISVLSLQLFWYFVFSSVSAIWYQLLQFGISVLSLQLFWYFIFSLVSAIWYQLLQFGIRLLFGFCNLVSASAIWYFCSVSAIVLVFCLLFSFCNLVFAFSFCNFFWSDILSSASAIFFGVIFYLPLLQNLVFQLSFSFCHDIYYQRDCLVTLVTCWYKGFLFSSYSYVLWQPEFYSDCSQLGFSWAN